MPDWLSHPRAAYVLAAYGAAAVLLLGLLAASILSLRQRRRDRARSRAAHAGR